ncbi:hypothetical protein Ntsu_55540 [Nocardia sp. IFM 10818]
MRDPQGMLVLSSHGGYQYCVIDGADLHMADPPVWHILEDTHAIRQCPRVSDWFAEFTPNRSGSHHD